MWLLAAIGELTEFVLSFTNTLYLQPLYASQPDAARLVLMTHVTFDLSDFGTQRSYSVISEFLPLCRSRRVVLLDLMGDLPEPIRTSISSPGRLRCPLLK